MNNKESNSEIIIYAGDNGQPSVQVRLEAENVWLTQKQMAELFACSVDNISLHLKNIFKEAELNEKSVIEDFSITASDGKKYSVKHYNLEAIISVGYRVNSVRGTQFRIWATQKLQEYIVKGFTMDDERLKNLGGGLYWKELLDRIRDIRSSEKVLYRQVLDLYATSVDYNPNASESLEFFKIVQNKLHYAAHGHTAAEVIIKRADAGKPFMGLLTFSKGGVVKKDIAVAKNYLTDKELKILNNLVSGYFDFAEVQAIKQRPVYMKDYIKQLDNILSATGEQILLDAGTVSHEEAIEKAEGEYKKYQAKTFSEVETVYLDAITEAQKKVEKKIKKVK